MTPQIKWVVKYYFVKVIDPISFVVNDFDSVLNVIRVIHFDNEVFRIEMWQSRNDEG